VARARHVLIWTAGFGGGQSECASALSDHLVRHHPDRVRLAVVDILERHLPRIKALAAVAYRNSAAFFPDGLASLQELSARRSDDPAVRELASGGLSGMEAALEAFRPDAIVSVHPLACGIASELKARFGHASLSVMTDQAPAGWWCHPATDLYCVANAEVRSALAVVGVPWDRIAVTGVPVADGVRPAADRGAARRLLGLGQRSVVAVFGRSDRQAPASLVDGLAAAGADVVIALPRSKTATETAPGPVRVVSYADAIRLLPAAEVAVCLGGGSALWTAPTAGTPLVVVEPLAAMETANVDFLVNAGAALLARDEADAVARASFLLTHPDRAKRMSEDASAIGRPSAARAVTERILAAL
jgi:processive 1,2-diacylglycerol beta-glucosyltransferase